MKNERASSQHKSAGAPARKSASKRARSSAAKKKALGGASAESSRQFVKGWKALSRFYS
jgi:hypothetical protein